MNIENKKNFLFFEKTKILKNSTINSVFPDSKNIDFTLYENTFNKYNNIIKDICAMANSEGGIVYIGVNNVNRIIGAYAKTKEEWLDNILKLSRVIYNTIYTFDIKHIKCKFRNHIVIMNEVETYVSEIIIPKIEKKCLINSFGNTSFYSRIDKQTISQPLNEEIILRINRDYDANMNPRRDIGDYYDGEEGERLEFKSTIDFMKGEKGIGKYFSSFGNTNGGQIIIGVKDDREIIGVKIENSQQWDAIKLDILSGHYSINNVDYLKLIKVKKIPLKTLHYYLVNIHLPKNPYPGPILVKEKDGSWNKWIRVMSSSIKGDRDIFINEHITSFKNVLVIQENSKNCENSVDEYNQNRFFNALTNLLPIGLIFMFAYATTTR